MVPSAVFLTKGVGFSREKLASFEQALRDAGISHLNLVEVSSILPPGCKIISKAEGIKRFKPGQITYCVLSKNQSNENRRMIAVSTGIAIPANTKDYGYLSEHHSFGQTKEEAGEYAEDLAASMLANSLGLEIDMDAAWDEKKEIYRISGKIIRTHNITQTAVCKKKWLDHGRSRSNFCISMTPFHFAEEIPGGCPSYCDARAIILPVPYEHTTSYLKGTARGPEAILTASQEIELFDEKLGYEVYRLMSMHTLPSFPVDCCGAEFLAKLESEVRIHLANGKLMVMLGGEHTITLAAVRAARAIVSGIAVLQIDAHADLRDSYLGDPFSHATVMRRVLEHAPVYQIGVRSLSAPEFDLVKAKAVTTLFCHDSSVGNINAFVDALPEEIYLTIDMDGFDPSVVPGVGTPEPGGLSWNSIDYILDRVSTRCRIRAFDVVELRPLPNEARSEVTAARLIYRLLGYIARAENSEK